MSFAPKWYRELYKEFAKENPTKVDNGQMKIIEEIENHYATKGPIPGWEKLVDWHHESEESNMNQNAEESNRL